MKRSPRRWSHERLRRYQMIKNEALLHASFYAQNPFWLEISDDIDAGNDNILEQAEIAARKEGR
jgi:hypothetical protein